MIDFSGIPAMDSSFGSYKHPKTKRTATILGIAFGCCSGVHKFGLLKIFPRFAKYKI